MLTNSLTPIEATEKDISKINTYTRRDIQPEELYTFSVILCGNDIDRDCEAFTKESLFKMANMFQGKTGILDHDASSKNQIARIYKTSVVKTDENGYIVAGEDCRTNVEGIYAAGDCRTKEVRQLITAAADGAVAAVMACKEM